MDGTAGRAHCTIRGWVVQDTDWGWGWLAASLEEEILLRREPAGCQASLPEGNPILSTFAISGAQAVGGVSIFTTCLT